MADPQTDETGTPGHAVPPPRTPLESAIANIWQDTLGHTSVGVEDDFFELGGESLEAVNMLAAVEDVLLAQVSFADFLDAPTVAGLAAAVQRSRQHGPPGRPRADQVPAAGEAPCTFAQERLWFVDQLAGGTGAYNEPLGARIRGQLDDAALARALAQLVGRHAALRTSFQVRDGVPVQVIADEVGFELEHVDLTGGSDPEGELGRLTGDLVSRPFDLARGPLVRACLLRIAAAEHVLQLVFHHMVCDGWAHVIFLRELAQLYRAYSSGGEAALPPPTLQYPDFARRQRESLQGPALEAAIAPWRERLADIPDAIELPTDRPRPPVESHRGATRRGHLDEATSDAVRAFSRAEGTTSFMTLLAVLDILLHRYSGQDTIMIGSATAGRDRPELQDAVGLFANTIVLRNDLSGDPTVRELLGRVRRVVLDAVAYQDAPFERLVAELQRTPDQSRHPIFQVFLAFRPHASLDLPGAEPFHAGPRTARADLTLWIEESARGFELVWEYSTDLFDLATIERLERHFVRLLHAALEQPGASISSLAMLDAGERKQLIDAAGASDATYPVACMHELFEQQAASDPQATAVIFDGERTSYGELNARANRLAHHLRALGVERESLVALFLERSLDMVVAVIAVLKAGGAYVPLDPEHPAARLAFVLADTGAGVVLTQESLRGRLPAHRARVVCLDTAEAELAGLSSADPDPVASPENLAYVIYTSGSTGQPKGVQVEHRHVARLFSATEHWYGFGRGDTWVLSHSYAFDVSVWELWGALAHGGRIVVCPFWVTRAPEAFASLIADNGVTVLCATPSLFNSVQDELLARGEELVLRFIVFAGEALHPSSLRPWFDRYGDAAGPALVNMYGITETTVHSTYRVMRASDCDGDVSPIGVPIPDLRLYLLDSAGSPVPPGVPGELYVGGAGVTRGYLNRAELTRERFLENPFGAGRLYRSGDIARRLSNGELEFRGRMDDQVKIRGFRIELGEIQAVLREHAAITDCAVVPVEAGPDDVRLAAYAVPDGEAAPAVRAILGLRGEGRLALDELFELPDGTEVAHLNPAETSFLFEEIFVRRGYLKHGIAIPADACVIDVGANIGLFALLVARLAPDARILAFEPIPATHRVLALNMEIHGLRGQAYDCALGATDGSASFAFYPHVSLLSGRYPEQRTDAAAVRTMLENVGELEASDVLDELLVDRLEHEALERPVRTVSGILREHGIDRVDLLKIDVEKGELDVLAGIDDADWERIRQVVVEVHGGERLREVSSTLERAGFELTVDEDELQRGSGLHNVYARRGTVVPGPAASPAPIRSIRRLQDDLRDHLEERLPWYMVPASIGLIGAIPLTTNGKLDRRSLPPPEWETGRALAFVAPRSTTEIELADIWRDVLGVEHVGVHDSFFHLGGHSLLAARVVGRVRERYTIELPIRSLFDQPTLAGFAAKVDAARTAGTHADAPAAQAAARVAAARASGYPLAFPQQQLLFFDELTPGSSTYNAALAIRVVGSLDIAVLHDALRDLFERHHALRTVLVWQDDSEPRQIVLDTWHVPLPVVDLSRFADPTSELERLLREHARRPFALDSDLMLRTTLFELGPDERVILLQPHHAAFDAWAVEILYRDLGELYAARRDGRAPRLPVLALQYGDFALWQRQHFQGGLLDAELDFWRRQLAGAPTVIRLETDHSRPELQTFEGASHLFSLDGGLADGVRDVGRAAGVTPYMVLLAAFATLLYRRSGQDDILIGGPMANRDRPGFDDVIGFFANTVVVRVRLAGNPTFGVLLERVRESVLESFEHQDVPFELVVEALRPPRDPGVNPIVQVNFRVRAETPPLLELDGTRTSPVRVDLGFARFDLAVELHLDRARIAAELIYNAALFEPESISSLARDLEALLRQALAQPQARLLSFELGATRPVAPAAAGRPAAALIRGFRGSRGS